MEIMMANGRFLQGDRRSHVMIICTYRRQAALRSQCPTSLDWSSPPSHSSGNSWEKIKKAALGAEKRKDNGRAEPHQPPKAKSPLYRAKTMLSTPILLPSNAFSGVRYGTSPARARKKEKEKSGLFTGCLATWVATATHGHYPQWVQSAAAAR